MTQELTHASAAPDAPAAPAGPDVAPAAPSVPKRRRVMRVLAIAASFVGTQALLQAVNFGTGLVVVRRLGTAEYAYFTVTITVSSAMAVVSNSGFSSALLSRGAQVRHDRSSFSALIISALALRRRIAAVTCAVGGPLTFWLLRAAGADWVTTTALTLLVMVGLIVSVTANLYTEVLALEYERRQQQLIPIKVALFRLAATIPGLLLWPVTLAAATVNLAAFWLNRAQARAVAATYFDADTPADPAERRLVMASFWRLLPSNTFFVLQGQVLIYLLAFTGQTTTLAQLGALGRYSLIFGVISSGLSSVAAPIVARCAPGAIGTRYAQIAGAGAATILILLATVWVGAGPLTDLLGSQYHGLDTELRILTIGGAVSSFAAVLSSLNQARGWLSWVWLHVPISVAWTLALALTLDLTSIRHSAEFAALSSVAGLVTQLIPLAIGLRRPPAAPMDSPESEATRA